MFQARCHWKSLDQKRSRGCTTKCLQCVLTKPTSTPSLPSILPPNPEPCCKSGTKVMSVAKHCLIEFKVSSKSVNWAQTLGENLVLLVFCEMFIVKIASLFGECLQINIYMEIHGYRSFYSKIVLY